MNKMIRVLSTVAALTSIAGTSTAAMISTMTTGDQSHGGGTPLNGTPVVGVWGPAPANGSVTIQLPLRLQNTAATVGTVSAAGNAFVPNDPARVSSMTGRLLAWSTLGTLLCATPTVTWNETAAIPAAKFLGACAGFQSSGHYAEAEFFFNWFGTLTFSILGTTVLTEGKGVTFSNALIILILSNLVAFVGYVFHGWLGDRFSRRNLIAIAWVLGGVSFAVMTTLAEGAVAVVLFMSIGLFFQIGAYSALLYYMADSFDTKTRATGTTFVNSLGQIGAVIGGVIITSMLSAGVDITVAALVVGAGGTVLSGLLMMGCRVDVPNATRAEAAAAVAAGKES